MRLNDRQQGITLVELMVALAIGSFLMIGAVQIYNQSRQAFVVNESIARVQETAQFAMDIIEADVRMASNWGRTSRSLNIVGRSVGGDDNPQNLDVPTDCGEAWIEKPAVIKDDPPAGFYSPSELFAPVWQEAAVRERLGWALGPAVGYTTTWQEIANHVVLKMANGQNWRYLIYDGDWGMWLHILADE